MLQADALDDFDHRILECYQHDTRLSAEKIGAVVGLSPTAVQRRLKRLRELKVIAAEIAVLEPAALGYAVSCVVAVDLVRENAADIDGFKARMAAHPEVQQCYYVTGQSDFILVVLARDMAGYESFTRRALMVDANVKSFTTHVVLDRAKASLAVPQRGR